MPYKGDPSGRDTLRKVVRGYLVRCHRIISQDYPEIARMSPANAADFLLHLQDTGRVKIELYNQTDVIIGCRIIEITKDGEQVTTRRDS